MDAKPPASRSLLRTLALVLVTLLVPIIPFVIIGELPGDRWLVASGDGSLVLAAAGAALLAGDVLLPIPSSVVGVLLGARLGTVAGATTILVGLTLGHTLGYWLGRLAPARFAPALGHTPSALLVLLTRPVPILAEAMTFVAGASRVPFARFLASAASGNCAYALVLAAVGATLLPEDAFLAALVALLVMFAVPWLAYRRWGGATPMNERTG